MYRLSEERTVAMLPNFAVLPQSVRRGCSAGAGLLAAAAAWNDQPPELHCAAMSFGRDHVELVNLEWWRGSASAAA